MQKAHKLIFLIAVFFLASCASKTGDTNTLAAKKTELENLKKQQEDLSTKIASLEDEIYKLDPSSRPEKQKLVSITPVKKENFVHYIDLQGSITSNDIYYVSPRNGQGGQVKEVYVKQGDNVKKGQLLLKLDDAVLQKNLQQLQTQLAFAQDIYNKQKNLWDQEIGTEVQLKQAKLNVDQLNAQIATLKEQISSMNVYSDVSGVAEQVNVRVGEFFTGYMGTTPQLEIVNNNNLKVTVDVPSNYIDKIQQGNKMIVYLPDINKTIEATISLVGKTINSISQSFYVEAKLPADKDLKPNQVAKVKIQDYAASNAITAPVNTLQNDEKGKFVMVAVKENNKLVARKKPVEVGQLYGDSIEILSGLQEGDQIITQGYQELYDGQLLTTAQ